MNRPASQTPDFLALALLSLRVPEEGARAILRLNLAPILRWMWLVAAVSVGGVLAYVLPLLSGTLDEMPSPLVAVGLQITMNTVAVGLITLIGQLMRGKGQFMDGLLLMAWLQTVMVGMQVAQLLAMAFLPQLNGVVFFAILGLTLWLLTGFICELHGFESRLGVLGVMLLIAFLLGALFRPYLLAG